MLPICKQATFILSSPDIKHCPTDGLPEVCFAGRSNVGKSSIINALTSRKKLARTSNVPGKTQQLNYYKMDEAFYLVDLPGYGYAKVPQAERERWGRDMQEYLLNREELQLVLHLVDARHEPTKQDKDFFYWLASNEIPFAVIMTKSDKITHNKIQKSAAVVRRTIKDMNIEVPIIPVSSETKAGLYSVAELILEFTENE